MRRAVSSTSRLIAILLSWIRLVRLFQVGGAEPARQPK
jgi:hypothetical protein